MLDSADADLARRDPTLRGLAAVLDPDRMADVFRERLRIEPTHVEAIYVRYKPATSCLVAYRLVINGTEVRGYAKVHRDGSGDKLEKRRQLSSHRGWAVVEDPPMSLGLFPVDARLRALRLFASADERRQLFDRLLPGNVGAPDVCLLAYKPERRFVGRLSVDGVPRAVVKVYTALDYIRARTAVDTFAKAGTHVARRLGDCRRHGVLAVEWIEGRCLDQMLESAAAEDAVRCAGEALRVLHRQPPGLLAFGGHDVERRRVEVAAAAVCVLAPQLTSQVNAILQTVTDARTSATAVALHGDFYAQQVLVRPGGGTAIIDLDEAECGDAWSDLANFVANLECDSVIGGVPPSRVEALRNALLAGYGVEPASRSFNVRVAGILVRLAPRFFRERDPQWLEHTFALMARAEGLLGTHSSVPAAGDAPPPIAPTDTLQPLLDRALNLAVVSQAFATLASGPAAPPRSASVVRLKAGRRCVIAYQLEHDGPDVPPPTLIAKIRPQGADWKTYSVQRRLWQGAFAPGHADGILVPEPIGVVPTLAMWVQRGVNGTCATEHFLSQPDPALALRAAHAIHKLHGSGVTPERRHGLREELRILRDRLARVSGLHPLWRRRLERVAKACAHMAGALSGAPVAPIHRDFYPDHLLADGDRLYLIDFDLCSLGDPALDAGNFAGHLLELGLRHPDSRAPLEEAAAIFIDEFARIAGGDTAARTEAYVTLTLARHVYISTQFSERAPYTEYILDLCEQRLARPVETRLTAGA